MARGLCSAMLVVILLATASPVSAADLLGTWSGSWEGAAGGGGPAELMFTLVDGSRVTGTYRFTPRGAPGQRRPPGVGKEVEFSGTVSGNTVVIEAPPPKGRLTVSDAEITGQLGTGVLKFTVKKNR